MIYIGHAIILAQIEKGTDRKVQGGPIASLGVTVRVLFLKNVRDFCVKVRLPGGQRGLSGYQRDARAGLCLVLSLFSCFEINFATPLSSIMKT